MLILNGTDYDWSRSLDYLGLVCKHGTDVIKTSLNRAEKEELKRLQQFWKQGNEPSDSGIVQHRLSI